MAAAKTKAAAKNVAVKGAKVATKTPVAKAGAKGVKKAAAAKKAAKGKGC